MKRCLVAIGVCAVLSAGVAAQSPKYGVTVHTEKQVNYAAFTTYTWTSGQPSAVKEIDAHVIAAVDRELGALGMTKATSGRGDVLVTYYSLSRTDVNLDAKPDATGLYPQYPVGTLVVALLDPASRRRLLRLRIDQPITVERAALAETIDGAVAALFAKYPTRRK